METVKAKVKVESLPPGQMSLKAVLENLAKDDSPFGSRVSGSLSRLLQQLEGHPLLNTRVKAVLKPNPDSPFFPQIIEIDRAPAKKGK